MKLHNLYIIGEINGNIVTTFLNCNIAKFLQHRIEKVVVSGYNRGRFVTCFSQNVHNTSDIKSQ